MNSEREYKELNDDWIKKFEETDSLYKDFYKDDLYYVNLKILYVNRENTVDKIREEPFIMSSPNRVSREEVLQILKRHIVDDDNNYTLLGILRYNITIDADDIKGFIIENGLDEDGLDKGNNDSKKPINNKYLDVIKHIDAINFEKTINMFHDLNELLFIFYEKSSELFTRDVNTCTKKIYLKKLTSRKKTLKKRFKV